MKTDFITTVDVILLTLSGGELKVALFRRPKEPFKGAWALPGAGILPEVDTILVDAAARVLLERTGIVSPYLEELRTFSGPTRDPRAWSMSIAYYALIREEILLGSCSEVKLVPVSRIDRMGLPFDHAAMIASAVERVRSKSTYSSLPVYLCEEEFTIPELHAVFEALLETPLNMANFRRKLDDLDILEEVPGAFRRIGRNRPAQVYRQKKQYRNSLSVRSRGMSV